MLMPAVHLEDEPFLGLPGQGFPQRAIEDLHPQYLLTMEERIEPITVFHEPANCDQLVILPMGRPSFNWRMSKVTTSSAVRAVANLLIRSLIERPGCPLSPPFRPAGASPPFSTEGLAFVYPMCVTRDKGARSVSS